MSSGINIDEDVYNKCSEQVLRHVYKWVSYKVSDDMTSIVVDQTAPAVKMDKSSDEQKYWDKFAMFSIGGDEPRFFTYDFHYFLNDGGKREKMILLCWVPDTCKMKMKMIYSTSKDAFKKALKGISFTTEIQANDKGDLDFAEVRSRVARADKEFM